MTSGSSVDGPRTAFSFVASLLLENARLLDELGRSRARMNMAAQQERLRLERDLHDGVMPRLLNLQLEVESAKRRAGDPDAIRAIDAVAGMAAAIKQDLDCLAGGLYPPALRELGLAYALRAAAGAYPTLAILDLGVTRQSPRVEEVIYLAALAAVHNAYKHGGDPVNVTVEIGQTAAELWFTVVDDGDGFDPDQPGSGVGLVSMRDRLETASGVLRIVSERARGTSVRGSVPFAARAEHGAMT